MVNPAPTDMALSSSSVVAASAGADVGTLSATDNSGDSHSFAIQSDPDNLFAISGTTLKLQDGKSLAADASANVTVRVTDSGGGTYDEILTITGVAATELTVEPGGSISFDWDDGFVGSRSISMPSHGDLEQSYSGTWYDATDWGIYDTGDLGGRIGQVRYTNTSGTEGSDSFAIGSFVYSVTIGTPNEAPAIAALNDATFAENTVNATARAWRRCSAWSS